MLVLALALAAAALASSGCRRRAAVGRTVPRTLHGIAQVSAQEMGCDDISDVLHVIPGVVQVRGCGQRREYRVVGGRGRPTSITDVASRASAELACERAAIVVESPAPAVRAVRGCGRRARYDLVCTRDECSWQMTAHTGDWPGLEAAVPSAAQVSWELPEEVRGRALTSGPSASSTPSSTDLSTVALPPAPGAGSPPEGSLTGDLDAAVVPPPP